MYALHLTPDGWLDGDRVTHVPASPARTCSLDVPRPVGVVSHWTASRGRTDRHAVLLAEGWRSGPGASAHVIVSRSGRIVQSVPLTRGAHHCRGRWSAGSVNGTTVGIELENAGRLMLAGRWRGVANPHEPPAAWYSDDRFEVPHSEVATHAGGTWHAYTAEQVEAFESILRALLAWGCPLTRESCSLGHSTLDPARKADPGALWMDVHLPGVLKRVFGGAA